AAFKGTEAALLFSSGYLANLGTISALVGRGDALFSDELNHASIIDGARLSGAQVHVYRHADAAHLAELLGSSPAPRRLVVSDVVEREPWRAERARALAQRLAIGIASAGFAVGEPHAAIVPVQVGEAAAALALSAALLAQDVLVPAIRPPSVPAGTARLRATVM